VLLALAVKTPERAPELESTPLTALDFFWGSAVPLVLEALPYYVCHFSVSMGIVLSAPMMLPMQLPSILAAYFSAIGILTLPIALFQFSRLRKLHYWLAVPVYLVGVPLVHLAWNKLDTELSLAAARNVRLNFNAPISSVMFALSLAPLLMLPGLLVALAASRTELGAAWGLVLRKHLLGIACSAVLLIALGQGSSMALKFAVPAALELDPVAEVSGESFLIPSGGKFLSPTDGGFLALSGGTVTEYDVGFNELRSLNFDPESIKYQTSAWVAPDGTIRVFHQGGMLDLMADGEVESRAWPAILPGKPGEQMPLPHRGRFASASGKLVMVDGVDGPIPRATMERRDMLTGEVLDRRPLPVGRIQFFLQVPFSQIYNTNEMLMMEIMTGKLHFCGLDEPTSETLQLWPLQQIFRRTDLGNAVIPDKWLLGSALRDKAGNVYFVSGPGSGAKDTDQQALIFVIDGDFNRPRVFRLETPDLMVTRPPFIVDGRMFIGGMLKKDTIYRTKLWSVALAELGIGTEDGG
jgi:hypothetical protein